MKWFLRGCLGLLLTMIWMELEICSMNGGAIWVGWVKLLGNGWYKVANVDGGRVEDKDDVECGGYGWGEGGRYG